MILLKEKRIEKNLTQKELAELSGVPQQNISSYESGARVPGADALCRLSLALHVPMEEIYRLDEPEEITEQSRTEAS